METSHDVVKHKVISTIQQCEPTYSIVVTDFFPFVTGWCLRPFGVFAAVDDHVFRLDSTFHHSLKDINEKGNSDYITTLLHNDNYLRGTSRYRENQSTEGIEQ